MEQLSLDDLEAWKPVPAWEGYYEVSDHGHVRSLPRTVRARGDGTRLVPGRVLKPSYSNSGGYPLVILQLAVPPPRNAPMPRRSEEMHLMRRDPLVSHPAHSVVRCDIIREH